MELQELINSDKVNIVDVRTPMEFQGGNVSGSINIHLNEVVKELKN
jgi:rhodanese-related sulfurtransferase